MAVNKVEYGNNTLIDLTEDTVDEESVLAGRKFHAPDGSIKEGKVVVAEVIDNLESESETDALSARQGKVLDEKIDERSQGFTYDEAESKLTFGGAIGGSGTHVYSDEEHVVGVWKVDGVEKKVYEKTYYNLDINTGNNAWVTIDKNFYDGVDKLISLIARGRHRTNTTIKSVIIGISEVSIQENYGLEVATFREDRVINNVTIQYTKTTD